MVNRETLFAHVESRHYISKHAYQIKSSPKLPLVRQASPRPCSREKVNEQSKLVMTLGTARGGNAFLKRTLYFVPWYKIAHSGKEKLEAHQLRSNSLPPGRVSIRKSHIRVREILPQSTSVRGCNLPVWWYKPLFSHPGFSGCPCWMAYVLSLITVCYLSTISIFYVLFCSLS